MARRTSTPTERYLGRVMDIIVAWENGIMREDECVMQIDLARLIYLREMDKTFLRIMKQKMRPKRSLGEVIESVERRRERASAKRTQSERPTTIDMANAAAARKRGDKKGITGLVQMRWRKERKEPRSRHLRVVKG